MYTPTKLGLADIETEDFQSPYGDGGHALRLGKAGSAKQPFYFDPCGPAGGAMMPAFGITGDPGSGKSLALSTIVRRLADSGGRAVVVEQHRGAEAYLRECGADADVTLLRLSAQSSLRLPLVKAFEPPEGASDQQSQALDRLQADLIREFVVAVCEPVAAKSSLEPVVGAAVEAFVKITPPHERTTSGLLQALAGEFGGDSGTKIAERLEALREGTMARLVLDDERAGTHMAGQVYDPSAYPILVMDTFQVLRQPQAVPGSTPVVGEQAVSRAVLAVVAAWTWRLSGVLSSGSKPPVLLGFEQAGLYDSAVAVRFLERMMRGGRTARISVGLTANEYSELEPFRGLLTRVFVGRTAIGEIQDAQHRQEQAAVLGRALEAVGVDPSEEVLRRIQSLADGEFLYSDHTRRAGLVRVDPICRAMEPREDDGSRDAPDPPGDSTGLVIGETPGGGGLVRWDISVSRMDKHRSGAAAFVGTLCGGKTVGMEYASALAARAGVPSIILDPEGDWDSLANIEELAGAVRKVRMGEDSTARMPILGLFPPERSDKAEGLVTGTLIQLVGADSEYPDSRVMRQVIRHNVSEYLTTTHVEDWKPSGLRRTFERYSRDNENGPRTEPAEEVAEQMRYFAANKLTRSIFSDEAHDGYAVHEQEVRDPITLIQTGNLPLPKPGARNTTDQERINRVVLSVSAAYAIELASEYRPTRIKPVKLCIFDECWRLFATSTGQDLIHGLIREAPSQNLVPIIGTQLWSDIPDEIMTILEVMFAFKQPDRSEVERGLMAMGMDASDEELVNKVMHYEPGECLHRDPSGNVGAMQWKIQPEHWLNALSSRPDAPRKRGER